MIGSLLEEVVILSLDWVFNGRKAVSYACEAFRRDFRVCIIKYATH
jgi:hypothetical protein